MAKMLASLSSASGTLRPAPADSCSGGGGGEKVLATGDGVSLWISASLAFHGIVTVNRLPAPGVLVTEISPPCWFASRWDSARPNPVPANSCGMLLSIWTNGLKSRPLSFASIPMPVSHGDLHGALPGCPVTSTPTLPPSGVNFTALLRRLTNLLETQRVGLDCLYLGIVLFEQLEALLGRQLPDDIKARWRMARRSAPFRSRASSSRPELWSGLNVVDQGQQSVGRFP